MRLLHITTPGNFELKEFYATIPPYAILSHRWEDEEVLLEDLTNNTAIGKKGYKKIELCCAQAAKDGFKYIWIDTCCIDKTSSVELQEAVNSMFSWYKKSDICYAYLSDCSSTAGSHATVDHQFRGSKWFTRGWTLQELIAPTRMVFYDRNWSRLGSKFDLKTTISSITRVSIEFLDGKELQSSSVAQRMSWASERKTTRPEDIAYCLIGLFGVTMPLVYGEGEENAFIRLEEEIIKKSDDHSLFAWKLAKPDCSYGLLAPHPSAFADSHHIVRHKNNGPKSTYGFTNLGLRMELPMACSLHGGTFIAALNCRDTRDDQIVGVHLIIMEDSRFIRVQLDRLLGLYPRSIRAEGSGRFFDREVYVPQQSVGKELSVREFHIHVVEEKEHSSIEKLLNYASRKFGEALGKASVTTPMKQATTREKPPLLTVATSSGRRTGPNCFDFTLRVGGTAGLLVKEFPHFERSGRAARRPRKEFAMMFFEADPEGDISWGIQIIDKVPDSIETLSNGEQTRWLEDYILDTRLDTKTGGNRLFRVNVMNAARRDGDGKACRRFEVRVKSGSKSAGYVR